jgi:hypothetical protein
VECGLPTLRSHRGGGDGRGPVSRGVAVVHCRGSPQDAQERAGHQDHGTAVVYANNQLATQLREYHGKFKHDYDWHLN